MWEIEHLFISFPLQCHARKRHPNQTFEVLQLSHEEAEQTISAYMKERGIDTKMTNRHDSKHQYQCSLCQFRSNHPRYVQQHIETNHKKSAQVNVHNGNGITAEVSNRRSSPPSNVVYQKFSTHPNFNPNRLYYCALCYRGYRWRYDVKRHHKTMHETSEEEMAKSRNFNFLEYVPHLDCLITATMSCSANHLKAENEADAEMEMEEGDDDMKLSIADARTVDVTEDEAAALFMIEPERDHVEQILIDDHPEESAIVFEDDRVEKLSPDPGKPQLLSATPSRQLCKPFRCPHCFYRTNWRTDCLRHVRARHKIEPGQSGYIEMSPEDAERTYDEYEQTYGFVVSKKVLARFTDFCQIQWEDLKRSIWERIKDKTDFEQVIFDRLRPTNYVAKAAPAEPAAVVVTLPTKPLVNRLKRLFSCNDCAFRSHRIYDLEKHICSKFQTVSHLTRVRDGLTISLFYLFRHRSVNLVAIVQCYSMNVRNVRTEHENSPMLVNISIFIDRKKRRRNASIFVRFAATTIDIERRFLYISLGIIRKPTQSTR